MLGVSCHTSLIPDRSPNVEDMKVNRFGLSRDIPARVKRAVRQNSRFGCVLCRSAVYTYEHIDPLFIDAERHDPNRIALLCPTCHALVTKQRVPKEHVAKVYSSLRESGKADRPSDQEFFVHYGRELVVKLGSCEFREFRSVINIDGTDVLSYKKCSETGTYTVSGVFYDQRGTELFRIVDNEWIGPLDVWDVEQVGRRLTIRNSPRGVVFEAIKDNENSLLSITKLDMHFPPFHVVLEPGRFLVGQYGEGSSESVYFEIDGSFSHGSCSLYLDSSRSSQLKPSEVKMVGGKGAWIEGTGIWVGYGAGQMLLRQIKVANNGCQFGDKTKNIKSIDPKPDQNYFVVGSLEVRVVQHPIWTEEEYYLNGQKLSSKPFSWGAIGEDGGKRVEVFHISRSEPEDLAKNSGFIGFYADDVLAQEWSDCVFEVEVEHIAGEGTSRRRVKRSDVGGRRIVNETNPASGKPFHPQEFAGTSPWKDE